MGHLGEGFTEPVRDRLGQYGDEIPVGPVRTRAEQGHLVPPGHQRVGQVSDHRLDPAVRLGGNLVVRRYHHGDA